MSCFKSPQFPPLLPRRGAYPNPDATLREAAQVFHDIETGPVVSADNFLTLFVCVTTITKTTELPRISIADTTPHLTSVFKEY